MVKREIPDREEDESLLPKTENDPFGDSLRVRSLSLECCRIDECSGLEWFVARLLETNVVRWLVMDDPGSVSGRNNVTNSFAGILTEFLLRSVRAAHYWSRRGQPGMPSNRHTTHILFDGVWLARLVGESSTNEFGKSDATGGQGGICSLLGFTSRSLAGVLPSIWSVAWVKATIRVPYWWGD